MTERNFEMHRRNPQHSPELMTPPNGVRRVKRDGHS